MRLVTCVCERGGRYSNATQPEIRAWLAAKRGDARALAALLAGGVDPNKVLPPPRPPARPPARPPPHACARAPAPRAAAVAVTRAGRGGAAHVREHDGAPHGRRPRFSSPPPCRRPRRAASPLRRRGALRVGARRARGRGAGAAGRGRRPHEARGLARHAAPLRRRVVPSARAPPPSACCCGPRRAAERAPRRPYLTARRARGGL